MKSALFLFLLFLFITAVGVQNSKAETVSFDVPAGETQTIVVGGWQYEIEAWDKPMRGTVSDSGRSSSSSVGIPGDGGGQIHTTCINAALCEQTQQEKIFDGPPETRINFNGGKESPNSNK